MSIPIRPPFTMKTALATVRTAEDAWNTRDPLRVSSGYSTDAEGLARTERGRRHDEWRLSGCELSDAELLAAVRLGDREAFHALYQRFAPEVFALCERILHSRDDAEDAVADVFWEMWRRRDRYDASRGGARTYLTTLGRSRAIDRLRSRAARPEMKHHQSTVDAELTPAPGSAAGPVGRDGRASRPRRRGARRA